MSPASIGRAGLAVVLIAGLTAVPWFASGYILALVISMLSYTVLATAWALFSGPTRYISLATAAFFGIGAYTVAALGEKLPWPVVLGVAALIGVAVALLVGLATLRLAGIYFVGKRQQLFSNTFRISCIFRDVNGLQVGSNVRFAGTQKSISFSSRGTASPAATLSLTKKSSAISIVVSPTGKVRIGS